MSSNCPFSDRDGEEGSSRFIVREELSGYEERELKELEGLFNREEDIEKILEILGRNRDSINDDKNYRNKEDYINFISLE